MVSPYPHVQFLIGETNQINKTQVQVNQHICATDTRCAKGHGANKELRENVGARECGPRLSEVMSQTGRSENKKQLIMQRVVKRASLGETNSMCKGPEVGTT